MVRPGQKRDYLSLGEVEGLMVLAWPVEPVGVGTTNHTAFVVSGKCKGEVATAQWIPGLCLDEDPFEVVPTRPVSPLHLHLLVGKRRWPDFEHCGVVRLTTGEDPQSVWVHAAEHAFWDLGLTKLRQLCHMRETLHGGDVGLTLPSVLQALVVDCLPGVTDERLADILRLRAIKPFDPVAEVIGDLDLEQVAAADELREFKAPLQFT